mmetsp:Transcript_1044/g.1723  ORF Transcript_1044/g.1723 Transcript_1044/m.1723 type:complete len:232 (+) Transcript_1044:318-1013(+)
MIVAVCLGRELVLVRAGRVLAARVASMQLAIGVLKLLRADMVELHLRRERQVRHFVTVVGDAPGGHTGSGEGRVSFVTRARLAEVVHTVGNASVQKIHGSELGKRGTERVAGHLHRPTSVRFLESFYLANHTRDDALLGLVEALVNLAVALRVRGVRSLESIEVGDPILGGFRATVHDVNRLVRRQVTDVPLSIILGIVNHLGDDESGGGSFEYMRHDFVVAATRRRGKPH